MNNMSNAELERIWELLGPGFADHALYQKEQVIAYAIRGRPNGSPLQDGASPEFSQEFKLAAESIAAFLGVLKLLLEFREKAKTEFKAAEVKAMTLELLIRHKVSHEKAGKIADDLTVMLKGGTS